jgi:hypothetical protein
MRVLRRGDWYDRLAGPGGLSEAEFERIFEEVAPDLFPNHVLTQFRLPVSSDEGVRRPDFALIQRECRAWWVIEVELLHHSLFGHVMPQVVAFSNGVYPPATADYLAENTNLPRRALGAMIRGAPPGVIVVADGPSEEWERNIGAYSARLCPIEIYRSLRNDHVLRCSPPDISGPPDLLSRCRRDPQLPRLVAVDAPAALLAIEEESLRIFCGEIPAIFNVLESADKVWLNPARADALDSRVAMWDLVRTSDGRLQFRPSSKGRKRDGGT